MNPRIILTAVPMLLGFAISSHAADIVKGDLTAELGPDFFIDEAIIGGSDTIVNEPDAGNFTKDFGTLAPLNVGADGTTITITGIGWALNGGAANDAEVANVTITYLGADGTFADAEDNVVIGSVSDEITFSGAGEYYWEFDTPLIAEIDGANDLFQVAISPSNSSSDATFFFKNAGGVKISVAGTSAAITPFTDTDEDGIPDIYETNTGIYVSATDTGTDPVSGDTDNDGLLDGVESNTGTFTSLTNTGTSPLDNDYDNDGLLDGREIDPLAVGYTGTNALNRDSDNDRLSDKFEIDSGLDPLDNADFDDDSFSDTLEVLFYDSDPISSLSFPGDGTSPAPGSFTELDDAGVLFLDDATGTLGSTIINEAGVGGGDFTYTAGRTDFVINYPNAFPSANSAVSISGFAWPVVAAANTSGDILLEFYDPGADGVVDGIDQDILVGTAKGTLNVIGTTTIMYWNFTPITFTSSGTALMVKIQSTSALRIKAQDNLASGEWYRNDGRSQFGTIRTSRYSIGGSAIAPNRPKFLNITKTGDTTNLAWDLNGAETVTLQRSTDLSDFTNVPGKVNTTDTTHSESSTDADAFFRLVTP